MQQESAYRGSMRAYLAKSATPLRKEGQPYPRRDELYDR